VTEAAAWVVAEREMRERLRKEEAKESQDKAEVRVFSLRRCEPRLTGRFSARRSGRQLRRRRWRQQRQRKRTTTGRKPRQRWVWRRPLQL
jgi:hypothetical protein